MEWKDVLGDLVEFIKSASPEVWKILVKQVYVSVCQGFFAVIVSAITILFSRKGLKKFQEDEVGEYDFEFAGVILLWLVILISAIVIVFAFAGAVSRLINPEFYAIRFLLQSLAAN